MIPLYHNDPTVSQWSHIITVPRSGWGRWGQSYMSANACDNS